MKKIWKVLLLMVSVIGALCAFVACDKTDDEDMTPPHVHTYSRIVEQSPTCSQKGVRAHLQCIRCYKLFTDEANPQEITAEELEMELIPHTEAIDAGEEPTCTQNGWTEGKHCSVCLTYLVGRDMIPATGHKEVVDKAVAVTCTTDGKTEGKHCSVCNTVIKKQQVIPATGHKVVIDAAQGLSCTQDGLSEGSHCSVCDTVFVEQQMTPATGHKWNTNNSCDSCHLVLDYTKGVDYTLNEDGESYSVTGYGAASGNITVPAYYEGKPVTAVGENAFFAYGQLTGITLPDTITHIEESAFFECGNLTSITLPKGVTHIGEYAFSGCTALQEISIPNTVKTIDRCAFSNCSKLTSVVIPKSVESIGEYAFGGCGKLRITVEKGNENYHAAGDCLIETTTKQLIWGRWNSTIPADGSVRCIGACAFLGCWELTNIVIPNGVTAIEGFAFSGCDLMSVIIPSTVTFIGEYAFYQNNSLSEIKVESGNTVYHSAGNCLIETATKKLVLGCANSEIPADGSVTVIGEAAFAGNISVKSIVIPKNITNVAKNAFEGCSNLSKIVFEGTMTQWKQRNFGENWNQRTGNYIVVCSDGTLNKEGNEIQS